MYKLKKTVNSSLLHITANIEPKQNQYLLFSDFYWKITQNNNSPLFCFLCQKQCTFLEKLFIFSSSPSDPSRSQSPTQLKKTEVCFKKFQHKKFKQKKKWIMYVKNTHLKTILTENIKIKCNTEWGTQEEPTSPSPSVLLLCIAIRFWN